MSSNLPAILFLMPFIAALLCTAMGRRRSRQAAWLTQGTLLLTATTAIITAWIVFTQGRLRTSMGGWAAPVGIEWILDPLSALLVVVVSVVALVILSGVGRSVQRELAGRESLFYAGVLLLLSGLMGMAMTADLFNMFVHLEVASLSAYALVASGRRNAARAAMEYLLIGSLGASLYLLGVGFLYAATGTLNMADVTARLAQADPRLNLAGIVLIFAGLSVKMGLFPLHLWLPSAYTFAPAPVGTFMAPLVTKVAAYALLRVLFWVFQPQYLQHQGVVLPLLCWLGAAAMIFGALKAMAQNDLWRLLAYSSISQMGLIALGAGIANANGLTGSLLHIANDALMKGALFLAAGTILFRFNIRQVSQLSTLRGRAPLTSAVIVIAGLSLVGIPPLCGFYGKWYVLWGTIQAGRPMLAAAIIVGTLVTAVYVFRIIEQLFFARPASDQSTIISQDTVRESAPAMVVMSVVLGAGIILLGLFNQPVVQWLVRPSLPGGL